MEKELRIEFSNYERTVWVINSIEGHFRRYYKSMLRYFDRYPKIKVDEKVITPDFTVVFAGPYEIVGEVKRALGKQEGIEKRYSQLKQYDRKLRLRIADGDTYQHETTNHDILLLINVEYARPESKTLQQMLSADREKGAFNRALSVFSTSYDNQAARSRWVLIWEPDTDKLRDSILPQVQRLSERHQDRGEPILIYPDEFTGVQAVHWFCNDNPPSIYVAVVLWSKIFPRLLTAEQRQTWTLDSDCQGSIDVEVTVDQVVDATRQFVNYPIKTALIKQVLELLTKPRLTEKRADGKFIIHFRRLRSGTFDDDDEGEERKLDHVKEMLIRAIARGQLPKKLRPLRIRGRDRSKEDKNQIQLI